MFKVCVCSHKIRALLMQSILEIIKPQKLLGCLSKSSSKRLANKNCFAAVEETKMRTTDPLTKTVSSTY